MIPDKVDTIASGVSKLQEIEWVSVKTRSFDVFAWVVVESSEQLEGFLRTQVGLYMALGKRKLI